VPIKVSQTPLAGATSAAAMFSTRLQSCELVVLGLTIGSSTSRVYGEVVRNHHAMFSDLTVFALAQYLGLVAGHRENYRSVVPREVAIPIDLDSSRAHAPDGVAPDACGAAILEHAGIDVQLLGIGSNGPIGFNEPGSPLDPWTRKAALAESTRVANARVFNSLIKVPSHAVPEEIATTLDAKRPPIPAVGPAKAGAVAAALKRPLTENLPASVLREHSDVTWILDAEAPEQLPIVAEEVERVGTTALRAAWEMS